jgi:hypothetical protein
MAWWHRHKHLQQNENRKGKEKKKIRSDQLVGGVKAQPSCGFALYQNAFHTSLHIDLQHFATSTQQGIVNLRNRFILPKHLNNRATTPHTPETDGASPFNNSRTLFTIRFI